MHRILHRIGRAVATLLVAVMVIVPVSDAFSCSLEPGSAHAAPHADASGPDDAADRGDDGSADRAHGVCAHNHCHHGTAHVPARFALGQNPSGHGHRPAGAPDGRLQVLSDGLMRPPRV